MSPYRVAWLLHHIDIDHTAPLLLEFKRACPQTLFLSARWETVPWRGRLDARGAPDRYPASLEVRFVGRSHWMRLRDGAGHYQRGVNLLSPAVAFELMRQRPQVVVCSGFSLWTMLACLLKPWGKWRVVDLWEGSSPTVDMLDVPWRLQLRRWVAASVDMFVTQTHSGVSYLVRHLDVSTSRVVNIPYLVAPPASGPAAPPTVVENGRRPRFLYIGQLIRRKGVHHLLQAWALLQRLRPQRGSLWLVGEGNQRAMLEQQAADLALEQVHFVGWVPFADLSGWYAGCDVVVFPTLEDTWGMVIAEALARGRPVVSSPLAGGADLIAHGETGFVCDPRAEQTWAELLQRYVDDSELAAAAGRLARERMADCTPATATAALLHVIEGLQPGSRS